MKMNRTAISVAAALVFAAALALPMAQAQEVTSTPAAGSNTPVTCDSALALLVGFAEKDLSYTLPTGVGLFDWGQYSSMSAMMMSGTEEAMATEQAMSTAEANSTVTLQLPVVLGEDPQCTQVRADVVQFVTSKWNGTAMSTAMPSAPATEMPASTEMATAMETAMPASTEIATTIETAIPASTQAASTVEAPASPQATAQATSNG